MTRSLYKPKGPALEYADLVLNLYTGCDHGCYYCCIRNRRERLAGKKYICTFDSPQLRPGVLDSLERRLSRGDLAGRTVHLCISCDPYPATIDTMPTRSAIEIIKGYGLHVQILTKGGLRALRDFDLLDKNDRFGVTYSCDNMTAREKEPFAARPSERIEVLRQAKAFGIPTWVSCEPVLEMAPIFRLITNYGDIIDHYAFGKLNYFPSDIDWLMFAKACNKLCKQHGRSYGFKKELRELLEKDRAGPESDPARPD